jgi:dolichol kinase
VKKVPFQKSMVLLFRPAGVTGGAAAFAALKTEVIRKSIHCLIALCPALAAWNRPFTVLLLISGIAAYTVMEAFRLSGVKIPLVSRLTSLASRERDAGRFVTGPVTLGMGALLALLLYPAPAAAIAIYALAFGDGIASVAGRLFGLTRPAFLGGKSLEGSFACFSAALIAAYRVVPDLRAALPAALTAALVEALPLEDFDNIALPLAVGFVAQAALAA